MRLRYIAIAFLLLVCCHYAGTARELVVMTYNVHNGVGLDRVRDHQRIADLVNEQHPHLVGLQELDSLTRRSDKRDVLAELAQLTGMRGIYAPSIDFDGGRYGIGILTAAAPDSVSRIALPGREESRMMVVAWFDDMVFINTHLSLTPDDAIASTAIIRNIAKQAGNRPVILTGDLNSLPASPAINALMHDFVIVSPANTATFPAHAPTEQIDYIMVNRDSKLKVAGATVVGDNIASDHRPVVVVLNIPD